MAKEKRLFKKKFLTAERNMMQNTDIQNINESKMDDYSSSHTRGAQTPGAWLKTLYGGAYVFSIIIQLPASLHPVFTILYCNSYCKMQ